MKYTLAFLIALLSVLIATLTPDNPFNFDWLLGWICGVTSLALSTNTNKE